MSVESIIIECPTCGRKMPSYRDVCFKCSGVEVKEAQYFVDDAKTFAPTKKQLVPDEVRLNHDPIHPMIGNSGKPIAWRDMPENIWSVNSLSYIMNRELPKSDLPDIKFKHFQGPTIHITTPLGYGAPDPKFHMAQLMDTELGAPEKLNETRSQIVEDPEVLAKKMPGRNVGYTKNGIKPKCPVHKVTVTELGQCPICGNNVVRRHSPSGAVVTVFNLEGIPALDEYVKDDRVEVYMKKDGEKITTDLLERDTEWLKDEPIGIFNFVGAVNKKSDGRSPRTGEIGDPKSPLYMQQYRHTPSLKLDYNVEYIRKEGEEPRYTGNDVPVSRVKAELRECECGCKVTLKELRRGDKLCPQCGLVLGRTMISQSTTRGGSDDVEYGGE
jgi:ssDNA-binding Zn-finger/Zn-ribbon topoisomerase 1